MEALIDALGLADIEAEGEAEAEGLAEGDPAAGVYSSKIMLSPRLHVASSPLVGVYQRTLSPRLQVPVRFVAIS
jgi:hypothetical protein